MGFLLPFLEGGIISSDVCVVTACGTGCGAGVGLGVVYIIEYGWSVLCIVHDA